MLMNQNRPPHREIWVEGVHAYGDKRVCPGETCCVRVSSTVPYDFSIVQLGPDPDSTEGDVVLCQTHGSARPQAIHPGSYVTVPKGVEVLKGLTVETWFRPFDVHTKQGLLTQVSEGGNNEFAVYIEGESTAAPTESTSHTALSEFAGVSLTMPTDGANWASLDGLGTDGTITVEAIDNGIQQDFLYPPGETVLEFDYALLYAEPPGSDRADGVVATVTDGIATVVIASSIADTMTPYAGQSLRFPTRDSSTVRSTPLYTASIDLKHADAFPDSDETTRFTLTIRTGNVGNDRRSPRAFVDDVRFSEPVADEDKPLDVAFSFDDPIIAGDDVSFAFDDFCDDFENNCLLPTSYRWDFDTHDSVTPPSASGSAEQSPVYSFDAPGEYMVSLVARHADNDNIEREATATVTVLGEPVVDFTILPADGPYVAPVGIDFTDATTVEPGDSIVAWDWDFVLSASSVQNPRNVLFSQVGTFVVRLTVTTASGQTAIGDMEIVIE